MLDVIEWESESKRRGREWVKSARVIQKIEEEAASFGLVVPNFQIPIHFESDVMVKLKQLNYFHASCKTDVLFSLPAAPLHHCLH